MTAIATTTAPPAPTLQIVSLEQIAESPSNPRKRFGDVEGLAKSLQAEGMLQPVLLRPWPADRPTPAKGTTFELVVGSRRRRAALLAKLPGIPAIVRDMSDREVLEKQLHENAQREDVHPLEEADGYRELHERHGVHVDEIAARSGKTKAYIYARLKLCALAPAAREAFLADKLSASTALLIARIPDARLQEQATEEVTKIRTWETEPMSFRMAAQHIQGKYMLRLEQAPFSTTDEKLVAAAGSCTKCPKRTGNQRELFADISSGDVCTDPKCYQSKVDADWAKKKAEATAKGRQVLEGKQAAEALRSRNFESLDSVVDDDEDPDRPDRTVRQVLGKEAAAATVLVRDEQGRAHEMVPTELVDKAIERQAKAQPKKGPAVGPAADNAKSAEERQREAAAAELRGRVVPRALAELVAKVEKRQPDAGFWRLLVGPLSDDYGNSQDVVERRWPAELDDPKGLRDVGEPEIVAEHARSMNEGQLRGLVFELVIASTARSAWSGYHAQFQAACDKYGVDLKALEKQVRDEEKAAAKAKAAPPKKEPAKPAAKKPAAKKEVKAPKKGVKLAGRKS
jgi:ParB/RepB/Spo0J family partition protein